MAVASRIDEDVARYPVYLIQNSNGCESLFQRIRHNVTMNANMNPRPLKLNSLTFCPAILTFW